MAQYVVALVITPSLVVLVVQHIGYKRATAGLSLLLLHYLAVITEQHQHH